MFCFPPPSRTGKEPFAFHFSQIPTFQKGRRLRWIRDCSCGIVYAASDLSLFNRGCVMSKSKRGYGRKWTAKDVALLKELYPECPVGEIAERFGRTVGAIKVKACYLV